MSADFFGYDVLGPVAIEHVPLGLNQIEVGVTIEIDEARPRLNTPRAATSVRPSWR